MGFTGAFDFNQFEFFTGGLESTYFADAETLSVTGSRNLDNGVTLALLYATIDGSYEISFDWTYETMDLMPAYDPAGYIDGPALVQLSNAVMGVSQSGSTTFTFGGGWFGIYAQSDNFFNPSEDGNSTLTITNFRFTEIHVDYPTWTGAVSSSWSDAGNWEHGTPGTRADFGAGATTNTVAVDSDITLRQMVFQADAPEYTIQVEFTRSLNFTGLGLVNHSGVTQTIENSGVLSFTNRASAGNIEVNSTQGLILFYDNTTAGNAVFNLSDLAYLYFYDHATAGDATINASAYGRVSFEGEATGGNATFNVSDYTQVLLTNDSTLGSSTLNLADSYLYFFENSQAEDTTINLLGDSFMDLSSKSDALEVGALSSEANTIVYLGGNNMKVGGKNTSAVISGIINDGGYVGGDGGSVTKVGTGTLTLAGVGGFTGALRIEEGTVVAANEAAMGLGTLQFAGGDLILSTEEGVDFGRDTEVSADATITADRATAGAGPAYVFGTLSIGDSTLTVARGENVTSGVAEVTFGVTTVTADGATFSPEAGTRLTLATLEGTDRSIGITGAGMTVVTGGIDTGTGSLTKDGTGLLSLGGASSYSGGTTINSGTLSVGNNSGVGSGAVRVNGGVLAVENGVAISNAVTLAGGTYTQQVDAGANLVGKLTATSSFVGGTADAEVRFLAGTTSAATTLTATFAAGSGAVASDILTLSGIPIVSGSRTDLFVLEFSMTSVEAGSYLAWLNGSEEWVNAALGNTGNNASEAQLGYAGSFSQFQGAYGNVLANYVGAWGFTGNSVWSVLNHSGDFAVVQAVPEPSTYILIGLALIMFFVFLRKKPRSLD